MSYVEVRQLDSSEWEVYKEVRLRALQESPDSFGSTFEREAAFSDDRWSERLGADDNNTFLVAELDKKVIGLVCGTLPAQNDGYGTLYQMWVDPDYRGNGVGKILLARMIQWAMSAKLVGLALTVTTINTEAVSLYELAGFSSSTEFEALREGSELEVCSMRLELKETQG
jgi:ribosomal protein S18 acetylase RimI-like enzyme